MKRKIIHFLKLVVLIQIIAVSFSVAQVTKVRGKITDARTKEPISFASIALKGTAVGTITDMEGNYFLQARSNSDTIIVACVGYIQKSIPIKKGAFQELNITLETQDISLAEIKVLPGENPANKIIRNIVANKARNNKLRLTSYQYEVYSKLEFDINNFNQNLKDRRMFNDFGFVFSYVDTSAETGKAYLPFFISETLADYYFQRKPRKEKEIIKANRISGIQNESVTQYTGQMYIDVNIYDNYLPVFGRQFVSPIADFALLTYKFFIIDTTYFNGKRCYQITFKPRRKQEMTFTGDFWVHDSTWAIKKAKVRIANDANINYVNDFIAEQEYEMIDDSVWFVSKESLFLDFNVTDSTKGFFGRKTTSYRNVKVDLNYDDNFFSKETPQESVVLEGATEKDTAFWNDARHDRLTKREENIYAMVDSIKEVPIFRTFQDIVMMLMRGYYVAGPIEYGPYFKTYSYNPIEGHRFRIGGRTSNDFSKKVMFMGHVAYGTKDETFKYGLGGIYMLSKTPRSSVYLYHKYDMEQLGQSVNAFTEDNILATLLSRSPNDNLLRVRETKGYFEKEWFWGFLNTIYFNYRQIYASDKIKFQNIYDGIGWKSITTAEVTLLTRLAWNEKFVQGEFERVSFGSEYPIISIYTTAGIKGFLGSNYEYYKLHINVSHHFDINPVGSFKYSIETGKIFGKVPFPLLRLHEGNETYALDDYSYNMMNFYEFASDAYLGGFAEHHFNGFFLNKIPLMRKLKFREVVYTKALIGYISEKNRGSNALMDFPVTLGDVNKPYWEAGVGIENILKVFRVDAVWRLSHLDKPDIAKFGIRVKLQIII